MPRMFGTMRVDEILSDEQLRERIIGRDQIERLNDPTATAGYREEKLAILVKDKASIPMLWLASDAREAADRLILTGRARVVLDSANVAYLVRS